MTFIPTKAIVGAFYKEEIRPDPVLLNGQGPLFLKTRIGKLLPYPQTSQLWSAQKEILKKSFKLLKIFLWSRFFGFLSKNGVFEPRQNAYINFLLLKGERFAK